MMFTDRETKKWKSFCYTEDYTLQSMKLIVSMVKEADQVS